MNRIRPKRPRLRLDPELYEQLRKQVLRRDGWRCQVAAVRSNLEVHHSDFRSQAARCRREPDHPVRRLPLSGASLRVKHRAATNECIGRVKSLDVRDINLPSDGRRQ